MSLSSLANKLGQLRQKPLLFALPLLVFVAVGFVTTEWVISKRIARNILFEKTKFQSSVQQNLFVQKFRTILQDRVLSSNIEARSTNSIRQSLKNYLQKGVVEQAWVYDENCQEIVSVKSQGSAASGRCHRSISGIRLVSSATSGGGYFQFIQSSVSIQGQQYLFVGSRRLPPTYLLSGYSTIDASLARKIKSHWFLLGVLILAALLAYIGVAKEFREQKRVRSILNNLSLWLNKRLGDSSIQFSENDIVRKIEQLVKASVSSNQRMLPDVGVLNKQIKSYESLLRDSSFWKPIGRWAEHLANKINKRSSATLRLLDKERAFFQQKKMVTLVPAVEVLDKWQSGIRERGARRFLRSLSETKSTSRQSDMLMQDIHVIENGFQYLLEAVERVDSILVRTREKELLAFKDTSASQKVFQAKSYLSFADALQSVQTLAGCPEVTYINIVSKASKNLFIDPYIAGVLLESYQLFHSPSAKQPITIKTSYKKTGQRHTLILDCESEELDILSKEQKVAFLNSLELAKKVNPDLSVHFSPSLSSLPLVVSWQDLGVEKVELKPEALTVGSRMTSGKHVVFGRPLE